MSPEWTLWVHRRPAELEILAVSYDRIVIAPFTEPPGAESTPAAATSPQRR